MKFKKYLDEASLKHKMNTQVRKKINTAIRKVLSPTYFKKIPLQPLFDILEQFNLVPLQEDQTYWDGFLTGGVKQTEQVHFNLGVKDKIDSDKRYPVIQNANLNLSYFKMQSGKYEIIAYVG